MFVNEIPSIVNKLKTSSSKSILIDGKWGIGKTHHLKNVLDETFIYFSLFGVESPEFFMAKISEKIPFQFIYKSNNKLFFSDDLEQDSFNGTIIAFDDLERAEEDLGFKFLFGAFDKLLRLGFKVICLTNTEEIKDKEYFISAKEKVFDEYYHLDANYEMLPIIIDNKDILPSQSLLRDADDNWRIVIRSNEKYKEAVDFLNKNYPDFFEVSKCPKETFFRCINIAVSSILQSTKTKPNLKDGSYTKVEYDLDVEKFGEFIANKFWQIFLTNKENETLKPLSRNLVTSLLEKDYHLIISGFYKADKADKLLNTYPFTNDIFYLDDEGKHIYCQSFFKRINEFDFTKREHQSVARSVIFEISESITSDEKAILIRELSKLDYESLDNIFTATSDLKPDRLKSFNELKQEIEKVSKNNIRASEINHLESAVKSKDYKFLTDYIYKYRYSGESKKQEILDWFEKENFCLPDLSKTIDYSIWSFCHEIARFISGNKKYEESFIKVLLNQCKMSKSKSLRVRCKALVYYNFGKSNINFDL